MTIWKDIELEIRRGDTVERRLITELQWPASERHAQGIIGVLPHGTVTATIECQMLLDQMVQLSSLWQEADLYNDCRDILAGDLYGWVPARRGRWGHVTTGSGRVIPIDSIGELVDEGDGTVSCDLAISPWWRP